MSSITVDVVHAVATIRLARPDVHNAFDDVLIAELTACLLQLEQNNAVRQVVLAAEGKSFSAGADLHWMQRMATYSAAENKADAEQLAVLMQTLNDLRKPSIAMVQGAAFGGGVGLVACCDIAIASEQASFCLSEVKLGLIPAVISPYVIQAIGARAARRYFLTAERFTAAEALRLGLVHEVVASDQLADRVAAVCQALNAGGPHAQAAAKQLIADVDGRVLDDGLRADTAARIAGLRASAEGREGLAAFFQKRAPSWL